ncbi:hypothetical protein AB0M43_14695 [Longispora sp. NPDC051575]|uniref:hypothetical protein n=1 Tax=Longispora sp. NPDC051575 TaxID=3154943 RepID=UPI00341757CF
MRISTGDGSTVNCGGPGDAWTSTAGASAASPTCGHTYTRAGAYTLTATVTWEVSWTGGGSSGTVPSLTTTASLTLLVVESQALN